MSIHKTMQLGGDEPIPESLLELQQLALGMFLIWDALGANYPNHELVERGALADWARKHKISTKLALQALLRTKERLMRNPWAHYLHCRDFQGEGWFNVLSFSPAGNADVLEQITSILNARPFEDPKP